MPEIEPIIITFGGGQNSRRRPADIDINECTTGQNFDLQQQYLSLRGRKPFDLVATAPNGSEIRGGGQVEKQDGTISSFIQAGAVVYSWDHDSTFATIGVVSSSAKLRAPREQTFTLDEYAIVTDLAQQEVVKKWDGTTFSDLAHNLGGNFYAKYCKVYRERAIFGAVKDGTTDLPHVIVGSERGDAEVLSVSDRPASTLVLTDPWFLITPDLKPINGLEAAFGTMVVSTKLGRLYQLTGSNAFDFDIVDFYSGSNVAGAEAIANIGNDIALGLPARIESLAGTINFGDVETDDLSLAVAPDLDAVVEWTLAYNKRTRKLFCFPDSQAACWVLYKPVLDEGKFSPWSKWTTGHSMNFQPSTVMTLLHPSTKKEITYLGDTSGNIYALDGEGSLDGGTTAVTISRTTGLIRGFPEGVLFDVEGWILYRRNVAATITMTFLFAGEGAFDKSITVRLPANDNTIVYNGSGSSAAYYGGDYYYGSQFSDRIARQKYGPPGLNAHFQVKVEIESEGIIDVQEIGLKFRVAK